MSGADDADRAWAVAVLLMMVLVVVPAAGAWGYGTYVTNLGEPAVEQVQAGASVRANATAGTLTVTFTSNQNADHLLVRLRGNATGLRVAAAPRVGSDGDEGVRLPSVGSAVTYEQRRPEENATVEVVVTAVEGETHTVVLAKDVAL